MAVNGWRHDYRTGYDIAAHLSYAKTLAGGRLPSQQDSMEFFTPPLSYVPAAALLAAGASESFAAKSWQLAQTVYAVMALVVVSTAVPRDRRAAAAVVGGLWVVAFPVWWRSFAIIRPEALLTLLIAVAFVQTGRLFAGRRSIWRFAVCGLTWGAACLTRQWAIPAVLGVVVCTPLARVPNRQWWSGVALCASVCAIVAGPFYLSLRVRTGSARAFNQHPVEQADFDWRWRPMDAAHHPTASSLTARPLDILTADALGDYWMYYAVTGVKRGGTYLSGSRLEAALVSPPKGFRSNAQTVLPDLARSVRSGTVLIVIGMLGILVSLADTWVSLARSRRVDMVRLTGCAIVFSLMAGYAWFIGHYTDAMSDSDTVKATYLVQAFPILGLFVGTLLDWRHGWRESAWVFTLGLIATAAWFTSTVWLTRTLERWS